MFTQCMVNGLIPRLNVSRFIFLFSLIAIVTLSFATHSYAENKADHDKESQIRKAVVNQLLLSVGKSKRKAEAEAEAEKEVEVVKDIKQNKKEAERVEETVKQSVVSRKQLIEKQEKKEENPIKTTALSSVTSSKKSTEKPKEKKQTALIPSTTKKKQSTATVAKTSEPKDTKLQSTPLVEVLSNDEMQTLMSDFMRSSNTRPKLQATSTEPTKVQSNVSKKEQVADNKPEQENNVVAAVAEKESETSQKTVIKEKIEKSESQVIPVGRTRLGRNAATEVPVAVAEVPAPATKAPVPAPVAATLTGWIYLGRFTDNKWESQTLDVEQLPEIGKHYAVKATMVNVRTALPKKGVMAKAIK
ncbi:MAG: hypothetical protein KAH00_08365, partial [Cocleimonas sp.]|nr:hypothetical protein [Cocleimonas sp.]